MKIHLISFATSNWKNAIERFNNSIKTIQDNFNFFESAKIYTEQDLDSEYMDFFAKYTSDRGYAMWSWKPYLISKRLQQLDDNDFLIYLDGGCNLHVDNLQNTYAYLHNMLVYLFSLHRFEFKVGVGLNAVHPVQRKNVIVQIKKETLDKFGLQDDKNFLYEFPHFEAGCLMMCKDNKVQDFMSRWYCFMKDNYSELFASNFHNTTNQNREFVHNGADQSVLHCMLYKEYANKFFNMNNFWHDMGICTRIKG